MKEYFDICNSVKRLVPESAVSQINNVNESLTSYNAIKPAIEQMNIIKTMINTQFLEIFNSHQSILKNLTDLNINLDKTSISKDSSEKLLDISRQVVDDVSQEGLEEKASNEMSTTKQVISELSETNKSLTWKEVIIISTAIIAIVTFAQSQLPNEQLTNIENSLDTLVDIETRELNEEVK